MLSITRSRPVLRVLAGVCFLVGALLFGPNASSHETDKPSPGSEAPRLRVPEGFVVEQVAGPPLVRHPMMAAFDENGRLFVAESAGRNLRKPELLKELPNMIRMLEDTDGDGHFDRSTVFADKMTFPMGALWHDGALYVASSGALWRLEDRDGDGKAERRTKLVGEFGYTGNAADVHGPFLDPTGRICWNEGRHGHEIPLVDGTVLKGKAARLFRCRTDGSEIERICGGGMDNPVEVAFTEEGEMFTTTTFYSNPRNGLRDAILHYVEGGVYPKVHDVLKEFKRTGDLLPALSQLGVAAPSGLMYYRGLQFGSEYRGNLFSAQFNLHKFQRHILERDGATFRARDEDFLVSDDVDFHPTDVLEDADGSLLVIDTGGWFRNGCPTSQIAKPEIEGAIYRVRRLGAQSVDDPRGRQLGLEERSPAELTGLLDDPRPAVRDRVVLLLAKAGASSVEALGPVLTGSHSPRARRNAVWALARIESEPALALLRRALDDPDPGVRFAAARSLGVLRDVAAADKLAEMALKDQPHIRRIAATALARIGHSEAIPVLFEALRQPADAFLQHAVIYALIQIANRDASLLALRDPNPQVRRAALLALDQMDGGNLAREQVTPLLDTDDLELQRTVLSVISARPGWSGEIMGLLRGWVGQPQLPDPQQAALRGALLAFSSESDIQKLIAGALARRSTPDALRILLLEVIARSTLNSLPGAWAEQLSLTLQHPNPQVRRQALAAIEATGADGFDDELTRLAHDAGGPAELRVAALRTVVDRRRELDEESFDLLLSQLDEQVPPLVRLSAAQTLGQAQLTAVQLRQLAGPLERAGALELPALLRAFERGGDKSIGDALVGALNQSEALSSLRAAQLRTVLEGYPEGVRAAAEPLVRSLDIDADKQKVRLVEIESRLQQGDAQRGNELFSGKKVACSACHRIGNDGGDIGPDLTAIGSIRSGRDLLEAIVFPSASFARGFQPYLIATTDGRVLSGLITRDTADAVYLRTADRDEVRLPRKSVEAMRLSDVSIMPQGLDASLNHQDLSDLLAYLQTLKQ